MVETDWVEMRYRVPRPWREELREAAHAQGISLASLQRLIFRDFLRNRYDDETRRRLQGGA